MVHSKFDDWTLTVIRRMVEANYVGRDELYAAAEFLDEDDARRGVCRRLAEFLGAHAAELQQILLGCRARPVAMDEVPAVAEHVSFDAVKADRGSAGVIEVAEQCEHAVKTQYDCAVEDTTSDVAKRILRRQRQVVEFGEQVLRGMRNKATSSWKS